MERLYKEYSDQVEFRIVYIREAHPEMLKEGNETGVVGRPSNLGERVILATECATRYKLSVPMVIDYIEGETAADYGARTVRATITDRDGRVAYYAPRGPFGFKISEIERALQKIVANGGYMPPPPDPVFGESAAGLACGIVTDPERLTLGETVAVRLTFRNDSEETVCLAFDSRGARERVVFENDLGQALVLASAEEEGEGEDSESRRSSRPRPIWPATLEPGATHVECVEGVLVPASAEEDPAPGEYRARFQLEVDEETLARVRRRPEDERPLWQGHLATGRFSLGVALKREAGCIACHGETDFHHSEAAPNCGVCHSGTEGCDDFVLIETACSRCHLRGEERGRRQILGDGGEFSLASRHGSGEIDDGRCLSCHDQSRHGDGEVRLVDPHSGGKRPWLGTPTDFCLVCHGGSPPEGVLFPAAAGSGYDKSAFPRSDAAREGAACGDCHASHGSETRPLLRHSGLQSPHR